MTEHERELGAAFMAGADSRFDEQEKELAALRARLDKLHTLRTPEEWTEEAGTVLWWHVPICEPPEVGSHACIGETDRYGDPTDCRRLQEEGWLTHWSPLPDCQKLMESIPEGEE